MLAVDDAHGSPQLLPGGGVVLGSQVEEGQGGVETQGREDKVVLVGCFCQVDVD